MFQFECVWSVLGIRFNVFWPLGDKILHTNKNGIHLLCLNYKHDICVQSRQYLSIYLFQQVDYECELVKIAYIDWMVNILSIHF